MGHLAWQAGSNLYSGKGGEGSPAKPRKDYLFALQLSVVPIQAPDSCRHSYRYTTRSGLFCASFRNRSSSCIALIVWISDQLPHSRISLTTLHAKQSKLICQITLITGAPLATIWALLDVLWASFVSRFQAIRGTLTRVGRLGSTITLIGPSSGVIYFAVSRSFWNTRHCSVLERFFWQSCYGTCPNGQGALILPLLPSCPPLVRGLHSKMRRLA